MITFLSAGGGGFGNPMDRDIADVEKDVAYGYVSLEKAKEDYGVVIDPVSLTADPDATQALRKSFQTSQEV